MHVRVNEPGPDANPGAPASAAPDGAPASAPAPDGAPAREPRADAGAAVARTARTGAAPGEAGAVALVATARRLFSQRGYAAVAIEEIVQQAGVARGALMNRFDGSKEELFRAVLVQISAETMRRIKRAAVLRDDPWESLVAGIDEFLDACASPDVQRIVLVDGPSVLGWDVWRAIDAGSSGAGIVEGALKRAMDAGQMQPHRPDALARVLLGALQQAASTIASADDPATARAEMGTMVRRLLEGVRTPGP